jgi:putative DNA primase/helicase
MTHAATPLPQIAIRYARRGWHVVPLHWVKPSGGGLICSCQAGPDCGSPGKHPLMTKWASRGKPKPEHVKKAFTERWPEANVGLATGSASGFWVLDVDPKNGGLEALEKLEAEHGSSLVDEAYRVVTPSGGCHFYFAMPDWEMTNSSGRLPRGIDVRGTGGQVVAPPSRGVGGSYVLHAGPAAEPAPAPDWLLELIKPPEQPAVSDQLNRYRTSPLGAYLERILERETSEVLGELEGGRNRALNEATFTLATMIGLDGVPGDWETTVALTMIGAGERAGLPPVEVRKTVASAVAAGKRKPRLEWPPAELAPMVAAEELPTRPLGYGVAARTQDDIGNGYRLADHFGKVLRWVPERQTWYAFEAGRWVADPEAARRYVHRMLEAAGQLEAMLYAGPPADGESGAGGTVDDPEGERVEKKEPSDREKFWKWLRAQRSSGKIDNALKEARAIPGMVASIQDFDADPLLLNTPAGTVDLRTGVIRDWEPAELLTMMTGVAPAAEGVHWGGLGRGWMAFLAQMQPDEGEREALKRAMGYTVTGQVGEQVLFVHHGSGANGKSVFHDVLARVLGGYSQSTPRDTFAGHAGDRHPTDVARMVGKRHVTTIEPRTGRGLDEDLIKQLTGGDVMTARFMRQDFFEFRPVGKIHYITNHLPRISDDGAVWRRVVLFDWVVVVPLEQRVRGLTEILVETEGGAVLAWLIEAAREYLAVGGEGSGAGVGGLLVTDAMRARVEAYRGEEDQVGAWIGEVMVEAPEHFVSTADLFGSWSAWCARMGLMAGSADSLGRRLAERGLERGRRSKGTVRGFVGLAPRAVALEEAGTGDGREFD